MTRSRTPGRPTGDAPDQRERLLDSAIHCFAQVGVQATRLRDIAAHAGVTPALLNYHFGNREHLLAAVVEERLQPLLLGMVQRLATPGDDPRELVRAFVRGLSDTLSQHPWLPPLWVREVLCEGGALREVLLTRFAPLLPVQLARRFAAAREGGRLNPDLDPRLLVVSLLGLVMLPYAAGSLWRGIFASDDLDDEALVNHLLALLERGLEMRP